MKTINATLIQGINEILIVVELDKNTYKGCLHETINSVMANIEKISPKDNLPRGTIVHVVDESSPYFGNQYKVLGYGKYEGSYLCEKFSAIKTEFETPTRRTFYFDQIEVVT